MSCVVLKICREGEVRRVKIELSQFSYNGVVRAIARVFPQLQAYVARYTDEEGDSCSLREETFHDFVSVSAETIIDGTPITLELVDMPAAGDTRLPMLFQFPAQPSQPHGLMPAATSVTRRVTADPEMNKGKIKMFKEKIASVKSSAKITYALKLISAVKVRAAQENVTNGRSYYAGTEKLLGGVLEQLKKDNYDVPLLEDRAAKKVLVMVITSDRGLCGAYNSTAIRAGQTRVEELQAQGLEVGVVCIGSKLKSYIDFREKDCPMKIDKYWPCGARPEADQATQIADYLLDAFYKADCDRVEIVYTSFISMGTFRPAIRTLLPPLPTGLEVPDDEIFRMTSRDGGFDITKEKAPVDKPTYSSDITFEQDPTQILNQLLPLYFNGQVLRTLQEAFASELASRMMAMQAATDNAKKLAKALQVKMNKARQAQITTELIEIMSGKMAIELNEEKESADNI